MRLHLLNTAIVPWFDGDCTVTVQQLTNDEARAILAKGPHISHIGHDATARFMSDFGGVLVPLDRSPWDGSGEGLVCQLHSRQQAGVELSVEEMLRAGVGWRLVRIERH